MQLMNDSNDIVSCVDIYAENLSGGAVDFLFTDLATKYG